MTARDSFRGARVPSRLLRALKKVAHLPRDLGRAVRRKTRERGVDRVAGAALPREDAAVRWTEGARRWRAEIEPHPWRALVVDATTLTPDRDSGSITTLELMRGLQSLAYAVTFVPFDLKRAPRYAAALEDEGFWCLASPEVPEVWSFLRDHGELFDVVVLCRASVAAHLVDSVQRYCPDATLVFETMDLHYLREERGAALLGSEDARLRARDTKRVELDLVRRADAVLVHSTVEKEILAREAPDANVYEVPYVMEPRGAGPGFEARRDLVFVGGYRHQPNVDAVTWFVREILPLVRRELPGVRLFLVGSDPPPEVLALACDDVVVTGFVEQLAPVFDACRVSVAPLRYGAGYKGKVVASMAHGVPGVLSAIAAEGMRLEHDREVLVATEPADFAAQVVRLYQDRALWERLARAGLSYVAERLSRAAGRALLQEVLRASGADLWGDRELASAPPPRVRRAHPGRAIFPSRFMRALHAAAGVAPDGFEIVPHGVVFDHAPDAARADRSALVAPGELRLLFAGRVTHFKGVHTAVDALPAIVKAVPQLDVVLTVVGDTTDASYVERLRRQIDERGLAARVRWEPAVTEDRLFELFQRHDVYVFPSLFEPFALTLILALEAGIPAVATATGGNVDLVVDHATGLLFPPGDAHALAERVAELAANPLLRRELSDAGRAAAARLTVDAMITKIEACLEDAARASAPKAGVGT